jgi:carbamoyltransferase
MSVIYGFYGGGHNSSTSLLVDGKIVYCVEEERMNRIKAGNYDDRDFPVLSSKEIAKRSGIDLSQADHRVFAVPSPDVRIKELVGFDYEKVSHHSAHNYSAYFTSGMEGKVLSVSYDGGGDSSFMKVFLCEDGKMNLVKKLNASNGGSLSLVWAFITAWMMGRQEDCWHRWRMCKDEGKLMGMAPDGMFSEDWQRIFDSILKYKDLNFYPSGTDQKTKFVMESLHEAGYFDSQRKREIASYNLQYFTEKIMLEFFEDLHKLYPEYNKIVLSGGLFANVKLNQKINELPWVEEIYICPAMGDDGLSLGSAIIKAVEVGDIEKPFKLTSAALGFEYTDSEIEKISKKYDFISEPYDVETISEDINQGKIIGWFQGRMEYGPRALGSRSILVRPTDKSTHTLLNERLSRHDTMPFAPMVMDEYFDKIFTSSKSKYAAQFMTICFTTKDEWIPKIPAVIQKSDKTARPQIVVKENLPKVWELMEKYRQKSGIPVLLNTSFNIHNEPIIENPHHAFNHLKNKIVDKLVIGNYVYTNR